MSDRIKPYRVMRTALDRCNRDIVFSFCQYGMGNVWEWGAEVGGNCWRTTGDIVDNWHSMSAIGFNQAGHEQLRRPGTLERSRHARRGQGRLGPVAAQHAAEAERAAYPHHALVAAGRPAVDRLRHDADGRLHRRPLDQQRGPGRQPGSVGQAGRAGRRRRPAEVWARPLADGAWAVGLFNRGPLLAKVKVTWADLNLDGSLPVRDLWRQKDLGSFADSFEVAVPSHGAVLVKVGQPKE